MNNSIAKQRYISFNLFPTWKQPVSSKGTGCFKHGNNSFLTSGHMLAISLVFLMLLSGISKAWGQTGITSLSEITDPTGSYRLTSDVSGSGHTSIATFSGTLEAAIDPTTKMPYRITGLNAPLFTTLTGTVKNLVLEDVSISGNTGDTGAIACKADGTARIYNVGILSGQVGGTGNTGGLVGLLDGTARVINCYSYANITGGSEKGGIVGNNNKTSKQGAITTMVMNCMFYGDIADGNTIAPIYGGKETTNASGGLPNYNFYRYRSRYSITKKITKYNCALAMEEKFINRFERYRLLLNSNKKLAAWYITGNVNDTAIIAKWVLETADRTISNPMPYPILKAQGKYPSIINYDAEHAPDSAAVGRFKGGRVGTLDVTISGIGDNASSLAKFTMNRTSVDTTLVMTDKDEDRFNFNYKKVQLPYFNEMGEGNCTKNRVVTGWEITGFKGRTSDTFDTGDKWGAYNFADRNCTSKDLYSKTKRVFSQGAYYDVPNGVTGITIKPHWATAAYVADKRYDVAYSNGYSADEVEDMGVQTNNAENKIINGDSQKVYTSVGNARGSMTFASDATVYDYAVVLVGNVHQDGNPTTDNTPYTIMSIDMDHDNEPDYSYIFGHDNRKAISPIRFDFLNIVGIAEAQMPNGASKFRNVSIFNLLDWFEITNTCVVNFSQFEYDNSAKNAKTAAPLILLGGTFQQFVSTQNSTLDYTNKKTKYIHVGSNAWFAKFGNGTHSDGKKFTPHIPISVTGGDYDEFYLSGTYQPNIDNMQADDAECYVSGGRFGEMAATSLEQIRGNVRWDINYADITNFYGGGTNANNPLTGSIQVDIANSHVGTYCGGPKFGDMSDNKTVISNATNCQFGTFFGAGYGGNSYNRVKYYDASGLNPKDKQGDYESDRGKYFDGSKTSAPGNANYGKKGKGVATDFDYEFFVWSTGVTGGRFYVKFVSFSLATTKNVTSNLKGCTVYGNFYGGGNLGKVDGTATSVLDDCTVEGSVYGGGYSASLPTIPVRNTPAFVEGKEPSINNNIGLFEMGEKNTTEEYEWKHVNSMPKNGDDGMESTSEGNFVYTDEDLNTLGQVKNSNLTIKGSTVVTGDVYGGGALASMDESGVAKVNLIGGTITGSVYGGAMGDENTPATVGNTLVNLNKDVENTAKGCVIGGNIFGCNNVNGTPLGAVTVHVYKTQNASATQIANPTEGEGTAKVMGRYDVAAVYGGGNQAAYVPTDANGKTQVIIDGCQLTSIGYVYGGGNAASAPATDVTINGTYEIGNVFAGGNGKDNLPDGSENPGANVGYKTITYSFTPDPDKTNEENEAAEAAAIAAAKTAATYGAGTAIAYLKGGLVHSAFGGSNTKGNVRVSATVDLNEAMDGEDNPLCDLQIDEVYGAGNQAELDGKSKIDLGCVSYLKELYGGAKNADINNDVELTVKSGRFDRVFGGNNQGGAIRGSIVVNIEETGCHPIVIGELYGGGNQAAYTTPEGKQGPTLNIKSFTSIGDVFGGGLGQSAVVRGNTYVNINEVQGSFADRIGNKVGTIGNVFGGGNAAPVEGSTFVNVGTENNTADITGNVYGGGNNAVVTGNANVQIGKRTDVPSPAPAATTDSATAQE